MNNHSKTLLKTSVLLTLPETLTCLNKETHRRRRLLRPLAPEIVSMKKKKKKKGNCNNVNFLNFNSEYCIPDVLIGPHNSCYQLIYWVTLYRNALRPVLRSWKRALKYPNVQDSVKLDTKIFHLQLLDTRLAIANSAVCTSLAIYHMISYRMRAQGIIVKWHEV